MSSDRPGSPGIWHVSVDILAGISYTLDMGTVTKIRPDETDGINAVRGHRLRELLKAERWSLNAAAAEVRMPKSTLYERVKGSSALLVEDVERLAPLVRMTPAELFAELLAATDNQGESPDGNEPPALTV